MVFWISSESVVMSPFSFLILLNRMLSLCRLVSLAKGLSILLIFSKNKLLVLLILCIVLFVSTSLISALRLFPAFYSSWMYLLLFDLVLLDELLSCWCMLSPVSFLRHSELCVFLLRLPSVCPHKFRYVVASFSLNSKSL